METNLNHRPSDEGRFASTHWTTVRACSGGDTAAGAARETLCRDYWYPVYAYVRRLGRQSYDAEDLTQEFFAHILVRPWFERADPSKGRFRSFLLTSLDHFLRDCFTGQRRLKRSGTYQHVPLDMGGAESRYAACTVAQISPVESYEAEWATNLVETAWERLQAEYTTAGKTDQFRALKIFLTVQGKPVGYAPAALALGTTVENVKVCVHRLRKRYGAILSAEVARTVASPADVPAEMRYIKTALVGKETVAA